jgi:dipeptidyl aminopeptidase/acylaminoacyl peptidase
MARHFAACFLAFSTALAGAQAKHFGPDDLPKIVRISDPRLSPDGETIAYVVGRANLKDDRWDSEIDFVDIASKQTRAMTHDRMGAGAPRWSPSGDRLAFIAADSDKKAQVFIMPLSGGGDAVQVTHSKTGATGFAWRPDGAAIAYAAADEEPEKKDEAKFEDAFEVGNNDMLERTRMMPVHLWMVKLGTGNVADRAAKRLTSGAWSIPNHLPGGGASIVFSKDGGTIVFLKAETPLTGDTDTTRLMRLNVATGEVTPLTKAAAVEENPLLSPDGSSVAYTSTRGGKRAHEAAVFVAPLAGGPGTEVSTALDRSIGNAAWLPDGKAMVVAATDHTKAALWLLPLGGAATKLDMGGLNPAGFNVGLDGALAFTATTAGRPAELFYTAKPGAAPVQMTHLQTVTDGLTLGKQETVHWRVEKFEESGVLTYPPEYVAGKKYPMVLYIHGGPTAASVETFTPSSQILAAHGWLVFEPNYRGSNSDGNAYETAIIKDAGVGPGHDVMAGVAAVEAKGIVDEKRIAVSGWSYGGYMTSWLIGNYPSAWKAAVAGAPVTDMVDIYALSDVTSYAIDIFGPSPFVGDNLKLYVAESPITYASKMRTPTLIMCDVGDYRVPIPMAYKLYHALRDNGVPVKFVAFPVSGHSPSDPIRARDVWRRWVAWLGPYLDDPAK